MLQVARAARAEAVAHLEFIAHSMPGGSPTFKDSSDIERLYENLEILFEDLSTWCPTVAGGHPSCHALQPSRSRVCVRHVIFLPILGTRVAHQSLRDDGFQGRGDGKAQHPARC
jgi:hypothetical protein